MTAANVTTKAGDALLDASTFVRGSDIILGKKVSVSTLFCLSNLLDAIAFQEHLYTHFPEEGGREELSEILGRIGVSPLDLAVPKKVRERIVDLRVNAKNLDFAITQCEEDGQLVIDDFVVDPAAAFLLRHEFRQTDESPPPPPGDSRSPLWNEVRETFHSVYLNFDTDQERIFLDQLQQELDVNDVQRQHLGEAVAYVALRTDLYLALSSANRIPYIPDALRSYMIAQAVPPSRKRIHSAAVNALRRLDANLVERRKQVLSLLELPAFPVSTPSVLALILQRSESPATIIDEAKQFRESKSASVLRRQLSRIQSLLTGPVDDTARATKEVERLKDYTQGVVREYYPVGTSGQQFTSVTKVSYLLFLSLLSGVLAGGGFIQRSATSATTFFGGFDVDSLMNFLTTRHFVCIRDPLVEGNITRDVQKDVQRLFGSSLSPDELLMLSRLRSPPIS